ncbi:hypothetical protein ACH427_04275 [Streptomyces sp. NPDC020379]|uniref:phage tail fiber protein n=1 Tax=Streptomyces sp. NPDC020379 TaxID=3365071 RepID=UPI00378BBAE8
MSAIVPRATAADTTRLLAGAAAPDNALAVAYLQALWSSATDRQLLYRVLPAEFLASVAALVASGGEAAFRKETETVKPRSVRRRLLLLTADPGLDATADSVTAREVIASGYARQALTLTEARDDQGRVAYASSTDIQFGPLIFTSQDGTGTITHLAAINESDTPAARVLAVWPLATPFQVHSGETLSVRAATLQIGVA